MSLPRTSPEVKPTPRGPRVLQQGNTPDTDVVRKVRGEFGVITDDELGTGSGESESFRVDQLTDDFVREEVLPEHTATHGQFEQLR